MLGIPQKSVWLVVACAALVAQVVPEAWGSDCDRGCCVAEVHGCCPACLAETAESPCDCQLEARQEQPLSVDNGKSSGHELLGRSVLADTTFFEAPPALGVSREYLAASLDVLIRPTRILYGVWRN